MGETQEFDLQPFGGKSPAFQGYLEVRRSGVEYSHVLQKFPAQKLIRRPLEKKARSVLLRGDDLAIYPLEFNYVSARGKFLEMGYQNNLEPCLLA